MDLFRLRNKDTPGNQIEYVDENRKIYNSILTFKKDATIEKRMTDLFKMKVIYEEKGCHIQRKGVQQMWAINEGILRNIHVVYHREQWLEDRHRPIEYSCKKENE